MELINDAFRASFSIIIDNDDFHLYLFRKLLVDEAIEKIFKKLGSLVSGDANGTVYHKMALL
jgi:hypothetical protein